MICLNGWEKNTLFHSKAIYYLLFLINTKNAFTLCPFHFVLIPKLPALAHLSIVCSRKVWYDATLLYVACQQ